MRALLESSSRQLLIRQGTTCLLLAGSLVGAAAARSNRRRRSAPRASRPRPATASGASRSRRKRPWASGTTPGRREGGRPERASEGRRPRPHQRQRRGPAAPGGAGPRGPQAGRLHDRHGRNHRLQPPDLRRGAREVRRPPPEAALKLLSVIDVFIATEAGEERTLKGVPPERIAARGKSNFAPQSGSCSASGISGTCSSATGSAQCRDAERYDVSRGELADMLYSGVDIDLPASSGRATRCSGRWREGGLRRGAEREPTCACASPGARRA